MVAKFRCLPMGLFDRFRRARVERPQPGTGVLPVLFADGDALSREFHEDVATYRESGLEVIPAEVSTTDELLREIRARSPAILHLLAAFPPDGSLTDSAGGILNLGTLMDIAEESGVTLLILAHSTPFENLSESISQSKFMNLLTTIDRNHHFGDFLAGLVDQLTKEVSFGKAFVQLAPQHQALQEGLSLPGAIAVCPGRRGKRLVMWAEAQP